MLRIASEPAQPAAATEGENPTAAEEGTARIDPDQMNELFKEELAADAEPAASETATQKPSQNASDFAASVDTECTATDVQVAGGDYTLYHSGGEVRAVYSHAHQQGIKDDAFMEVMTGGVSLESAQFRDLTATPQESLPMLFGDLPHVATEEVQASEENEETPREEPHDEEDEEPPPAEIVGVILERNQGKWLARVKSVFKGTEVYSAAKPLGDTNEVYTDAAGHILAAWSSGKKLGLVAHKGDHLGKHEGTHMNAKETVTGLLTKYHAASKTAAKNPVVLQVPDATGKPVFVLSAPWGNIYLEPGMDENTPTEPVPEEVMEQAVPAKRIPRWVKDIMEQVTAAKAEEAGCDEDKDKNPVEGKAEQPAETATERHPALALIKGSQIATIDRPPTALRQAGLDKVMASLGAVDATAGSTAPVVVLYNAGVTPTQKFMAATAAGHVMIPYQAVMSVLPPGKTAAKYDLNSSTEELIKGLKTMSASLAEAAALMSREESQKAADMVWDIQAELNDLAEVV